MCIAIYKPAGAWASKRQLRNCFVANPSGAGFAWHEGERVQIRKGFFTWRQFWIAYRDAVSSKDSALIHFRITTRGSNSIENCHPYSLGNGALMHNGPCLNYKYCSGDEANDRSDSRQFAEDFIAGMTSTQVKRIAPMIESFIGSEKIVMLFDDGEVILCNEKEGTWDNGCWWSNFSFRGYGTRSIVTPRYSLYGDYDYPETKSTTQKPVSIWSGKFKRFLPKYVTLDKTRLEWRESLHAYVPPDTLDNAVADDDYVYEDLGTGLVVVGDVLHDDLDLNAVLALNEDIQRSRVVALTTKQ